MPTNLRLSIWGWKGLSSVGHCMLWDPVTNEAILSQFPHDFATQATASHGPNIRYTVAQTQQSERRPASVEFDLSIADAKAADFQREVALQVATAFWDWWPEPPMQTHCARAVFQALMAGGLPLDPQGEYRWMPGDRCEILPNSVWRLLLDAGYRPAAQTEPNLSDQMIADATALVTQARATSLWA